MQRGNIKLKGNNQDIQIRNAEYDIKRSHEIIAGLQTLPKIKFAFVNSLIEFHEIRIKNCSDAIEKYHEDNIKRKLKRIETELINIKQEIS